MLGVTVPVFGGSAIASYQYSNATNIVTATVLFEPDYSVWGVGYSYPCSSRTNMYVGYGQRDRDGTIRVAAQANAPNYSNIADRSQFALGGRHLF
jgi:predicted porin